MPDDPIRDRIAHLHPPHWSNPSYAGIYDLVVLGAGPGGVSAAKEARRLGASVALIERDLIGGNKINTGSVPSKAILRTARAYADMRAAPNSGARRPDMDKADVAFALDHMKQLQSRLSRLENVRSLTDAGIDIYFGAGHFTQSDAIAVDGQTLQFKHAIIATGSRPVKPTISGLEEAGYLTSETIFSLNDLPKRILLIGGGALGCEFAQALARLDVFVAIAQHDPMFLPGEERDAAQILSSVLERDGVETHLNTDVISVAKSDKGKVATLLSAGQESSITVDEIIVGVGRAPNVENIGLDLAGIDCVVGAGIKIDDWLRTTNERVFAIGDVCLDLKFVHSAEATARMAVQNALRRDSKRLSALTIPWCTYTDPEIAHVGLYVREASGQCIPIKTYTVLLQDVDRAVLDGEDEGFVKIHVVHGSDRILGATIVARHAGEMINSISLAINCGIGLSRLAEVIHAYPTQAEAIKMAADVCAFDLSSSLLG